MTTQVNSTVLGTLGNVNVTGNVLASSYVGGGINITGNILSTGAIHNLLTVNGNITVSSNIVFSGWSVRETGTKLYFAYNGVNKMSLDTGGNLVVTGDVTGYGTIT